MKSAMLAVAGIKLDSDGASDRDRALAARLAEIEKKKDAALRSAKKQADAATVDALEERRLAFVAVAAKREASEHAIASDAHAVLGKLMPQFKSDKGFEAAPLLIKEVARLEARAQHELADSLATTPILCQATADSQGMTSATFSDEFSSPSAPMVIARLLAKACADEDEVAVVDQARRLLSAVRSKTFSQSRFFVARAVRRWATSAGRAGAISFAHAEEIAESTAKAETYVPLAPGTGFSHGENLPAMTPAERNRARAAEALGGEVPAAK